ncbi:MAG: type II 3-dehydroquinate dehydratase [Gammaproteobacteria bacterium]|nr:type II 3-dehydroquinate dehydratase [Gammaproteobacteria bacterium]MCH9744351.1 type II 3-dehydroquinate dehydratase [Gammaproteobacteria bacterium]
MANIWIIHGPNLDRLGEREPALYGTQNLETINQQLLTQAETLQHTIQCHQSNAEHDIINWITTASKQNVDCIILNAAAFTHTSIAIRDALLASNTAFIEVHLSNVKARETFRKTSYLEDIAIGCIYGFGANSYALALSAADHYLTLKSNKGRDYGHTQNKKTHRVS